MKRIKRENMIFTMSSQHPPVLKVKAGETVIFETYDCYTNQIQSENQVFSSIKKELNNPATGPLYIEGAEVGDTLKIEILDIRINDHGVMTARPDNGVLGDYFDEPKSKIIQIKDGLALFNDDIHIPINPMIGVIGVAPGQGAIPTTTPDAHGGNMDCKRIVKGATLYLPVQVKGGLLAIGDLHAVMADGEIVICALEVDGEVVVKCDVIKGSSLPLPLVIEGEHIMTIASALTLDEAAKMATINMHQLLMEETGLESQEAGMLLSLIGELRICQVVDPLMTARMEFPLAMLQQLGAKSFS